MEERRRFVRLATRANVAYTALLSGTAQQAITKDISGGGLRVFAERALPAGTPLQIALALPGCDEPVNAIAEVVWSEQYETVGKTDRLKSVELGARVVEIAPKDQEAVNRFIASQLRSGP